MLLGRLKGCRFGLSLHAFPWEFVLFGLCALLLRVRLDPASVGSNCSYVRMWCSFLVVPGAHAGLEEIDWGMVLYTECFCKSSRVRSCRMVLSDSQKAPTQAPFEPASSITSSAIYAISAAIRSTRSLTLTL